MPHLVCPLLAPCSRCRNHFPTCRHCQSSFSSLQLLSAFLPLERRLPTQSPSSFLELLSLELALQLLVLLERRSFWELPFWVWARQSLSRSRRQSHKISSRRLFWGLWTFWSWVHCRSRCRCESPTKTTHALEKECAVSLLVRERNLWPIPRSSWLWPLRTMRHRDCS